MKHLHILGVCGTFMAGVALLARELGWRVSGSDAGVYPPMSDQLREQGIELIEGWDLSNLSGSPDLYLIGNALSRGNPAVERILDEGLAYRSGPDWLREELLQTRHVLAVAGTHGKTTTTSLLTHILEQAGLAPGFLVGGVPANFGVSARIGGGTHFVIEADEYDTAFFDKASKFIHYRPRTLVLNNLEFDHADIFDSLDDIQRQFHHLVRTVPSSGLIVHNADDEAIDEVLAMGCWSPCQGFGTSGQWRLKLLKKDASRFEVLEGDTTHGQVEWALCGRHNASNALAAIAAAAHVGIPPSAALAALPSFRNAHRRLENWLNAGGISYYDDFAHHPTAIQLTLEALRARVGNARIIAVLDIGSRSMRMGIHERSLPAALAAADEVVLHASESVSWEPGGVIDRLGVPGRLAGDAETVLTYLNHRLRQGDHVLLMSNRSFGGLRDKLTALARAEDSGTVVLPGD